MREALWEPRSQLAPGPRGVWRWLWVVSARTEPNCWSPGARRRWDVLARHNSPEHELDREAKRLSNWDGRPRVAARRPPLDLHRHLWPGPQGARSQLWGGSGGCREAGWPDVLLFTGQFQAHRTRHLAVRDHRCWVQSCTLTAHPRGWENQIAAQVQNNDAWSWREGSVTFYRILRKSGPFS